MTATLTPRQDALNETYADVEKLIYHTVHAFVKRYGGVFEDWVQESGSLFMVAFNSFDKNNGSSFSTWVRWVVWKGMLEQLRRGMKHNERMQYTDELGANASPAEFVRIEFMDELTEDARLVARLVLDAPRTLAAEYEKHDNQPKKVRSIIKEYLGHLGWSTARIRESFEEVAKVLRS